MATKNTENIMKNYLRQDLRDRLDFFSPFSRRKRPNSIAFGELIKYNLKKFKFVVTLYQKFEGKISQVFSKIPFRRRRIVENHFRQESDPDKKNQ